jgi:hypothetical protein
VYVSIRTFICPCILSCLPRFAMLSSIRPQQLSSPSQLRQSVAASYCQIHCALPCLELGSHYCPYCCLNDTDESYHSDRACPHQLNNRAQSTVLPQTAHHCTNYSSSPSPPSSLSTADAESSPSQSLPSSTLRPASCWSAQMSAYFQP